MHFCNSYFIMCHREIKLLVSSCIIGTQVLSCMQCGCRIHLSARALFVPLNGEELCFIIQSVYGFCYTSFLLFCNKETNLMTALPFPAILDWILEGAAQRDLTESSYLLPLAAAAWSIYGPRAQHHGQILLDGSQFCSCCYSAFFNVCPTQMHWKKFIVARCMQVSGPFVSKGIWKLLWNPPIPSWFFA